jgi:hypothetical protein
MIMIVDSEDRHGDVCVCVYYCSTYYKAVRVCLLRQYLLQSCSRGGGGVCVYYCRTDVLCVCLLLQDLVQSCVRGEGGDIGGHVLRETTGTREEPGTLIQGAPVCVFITVCVYYCRT